MCNRKVNILHKNVQQNDSPSSGWYLYNYNKKVIYNYFSLPPDTKIGKVQEILCFEIFFDLISLDKENEGKVFLTRQNSRYIALLWKDTNHWNYSSLASKQPHSWPYSSVQWPYRHKAGAPCNTTSGDQAILTFKTKFRILLVEGKMFFFLILLTLLCPLQVSSQEIIYLMVQTPSTESQEDIDHFYSFIEISWTQNPWICSVSCSV